MKKQLLLAASLLTLALPFASILPVQASVDAQNGQQASIVRSVNFRTQPSTDSSRIRYLQAGEVVEIVSAPNDYWLYVRDAKGQTGYVSSSPQYILLVPLESTNKPNAEVISSVSFRTGPTTSHARIRYLKVGEPLWIIGKENEYWYKAVDKNNVIGYLSTNAKYITTSYKPPVPEPKPEQTAPPTEQPETSEASESDTHVEADFPAPPNATIVHSVSFRTGPSTSDARIRYMQVGEHVWIIAKHNSYWYKVVDSKGVTGYVSTSPTYIDSRYTAPAGAMNPEGAVESIIQAGMKYLGTPYEFGSSRYDTTTFDCSDFVRQAFIDGIGLQLPGDSRRQSDYVKNMGHSTTDWRQLKRGDLMFFMSYKGTKAADYDGIDKSAERITHVAIHLGDGQMLHTYSNASGGVRLDTIEGKSWEYRFLSGGSAL